MAEAVSASAEELLTEARDATDALLERWAAPARDRGPARPTARRWATRSGVRASGCGRRSSWPGTDRSVGAPPPSPVSRPRSRRCTRTRSCTTTSPAWTTTTSAAAARRPIVGSACRWRPAPATCWCRSRRRSSPRRPPGSGLGARGLGRMAAALFEAGGIEGMVGGQWLDLEAEGRLLELAELTAVHRGKTGELIRAACILGGLAAGAGRARGQRAVRLWSGDRPGVPDRRRRARRHRHERSAREDRGPRSGAGQVHVRARAGGRGRARRGGTARGPGRGAPRGGRRAVGVPGGPGAVYCDEKLVALGARGPRCPCWPVSSPPRTSSVCGAISSRSSPPRSASG